MSFPALPNHTSVPWPAQILQAYKTIHDLFYQANQALQSKGDPTQLHYHRNAIPILHVLEALTHQSDLPLYWVAECAAHFGILLQQLEDAQQRAMGQ